MSADESHEDTKRLSREDIETLCVLEALGEGRCESGVLAMRLGFDTQHADVVRAAAVAISKKGYVTLDEASVTRTPEGTGWLRECLTAIKR